MKPHQRRWSWQAWLPSRGNVLLAIVIGLFLWHQNAGATTSPLTTAAAPSTTSIAYQGRLADAAGNPLNGTYAMTFRLYASATDGTALWSEQRTSSESVTVSNGLFNVLLGSLNPLPQSLVTTNTSLWLGVAIGTDAEMTPRVQLGTVPFAMQALTVPNGSISPAKLDRAYLQLATGNDARFQYGSTAFSDPACTNIGINFPQSFAAPPVVTITQRETTNGAAGLVIYAVTSTGFRVAKYTNCNVVFNVDWIAVGR